MQAAGGVIAIETDRVLLGWLPPGARSSLAGNRHIRSVHDSGVVTYVGLGNTFRHRQSQIALDFFDFIKSGRASSMVEQSLLRAPGQLLAGDARDNPTVIARLASGKLAPKADNTNGPPWTNDNMRGIVQVTAFEMESDNTRGENWYTWTTTHHSQITNQILMGYAFWANQAAARGITLTFRIGVWEPYSPNCLTGYEAIRHNSYEDYLWVNEILSKQDSNPPYYVGYPGRAGGWGASPVTQANVFATAEAYNEASKLGWYTPANWAFCIFVAYNPPGAPEVFLDNARGYAYYGGPFQQVMYNTAGWLPERLNIVLNHEIGHTFWACDEYYDPGNPSAVPPIPATGCFTCNSCRTYGPRVTATNGNCKNTSATGSCSFPKVSCIMDRAEQQALCGQTPAQIGW